jgi:arylsulfatase A-like enzyme
MHVPLVFVGPGIPKRETKAFAYLMDLYPTVCELTATPIPQGLDGKSLVPVITGKSPGVRDCCFTAYRDVQRAVRDERWKLIRYPQIDKTQLFDLQADPHEMIDLAAKPEHAAKIKELTARMEQSQRQYGDACPLTAATPKPASWNPPSGDNSEQPKRPRRKVGGGRKS